MSCPPSSSSAPPARRMALLEARLNPSAPVTDEDEVRSFSSDASIPLQSFNPRRRYGPRARSRDSTTNITKKRKRGSPASMRNTRVDSFFKPAGSKKVDNEVQMNVCQSDSDDDEVVEGSPVRADGYRHFRERVDKLTAENDSLKETQKETDELRAENEDLRTQIELEVPDLKAQLRANVEEVARHAARANALAKALRDAVVKVAKAERRDARDKMNIQGERLGKVVVQRSGTSLHEVWEDGDEWKEAAVQLKKVQIEREMVERKRKEIVKRKAVALKSQSSENSDQDGAAGETKVDEMPPPPTPASQSSIPFEDTVEYLVEQEELYRVQLQLLKREEASLQEQRVRLAWERDIMVRELRRLNDERSSTFNDYPLLNKRYVLLNLLGRGGFSEVYKAFDMEAASPVACKIHQLASHWSEEKKKSFIRHAMREYEIHKSLKHPRVVRLVDIFEIDENTFCTVLEYCEGSDLDTHLRAQKTLSEKEARSIISQVFSGLQYLAAQKKRVIHYDLKPGNILLYKGEVQITDFGLSKVMSETESTTEGMELTSQGAGTMWYLPPECFEPASQARISVKVDVWSAGVILYQMLYGRKPFGHDQSQEKMYREKTVAHQELTFPVRPVVSETAKDFMTKCLTRKPSGRPDVRQALLHPFLRKR